MVIKTFNQLDETSKEKLYEFITNIDDNYDNNYKQMTELFNSNVFNYGESVFVAIDNGVIKGILAVITKEISTCNIVYLTQFYLNKTNLNNKNIMNMLMNSVENYLTSFNYLKIVLGIRKSSLNLSEYIKDYNFTETYDAIIMSYDISNFKNEVNNDVQFIPLVSSNKKEFTIIHNEAFKNSENAATIDFEDTDRFLAQCNGDNELLGIIKNDNIYVGVYMLSCIDKEGWIDNVAILEEFRGNGIGKKVIDKSIDILIKRSVNDIKLLVMSSNSIARHLYIKYGFKDSCIFSKWFEKYNK